MIALKTSNNRNSLALTSMLSRTLSLILISATCLFNSEIARALQTWPTGCETHLNGPCIWRTETRSAGVSVAESPGPTQITLGPLSKLVRVGQNSLRLVEGKLYLTTDLPLLYQEFGATHEFSGAVVFEKNIDRWSVFQLEGSSSLRFGNRKVSLPEGFWLNWSLGQPLPTPQPIEESNRLVSWGKEGLFSVGELGRFLKRSQDGWQAQQRVWSDAVTRSLASENQKNLSRRQRQAEESLREEATQRKLNELFRRRFFTPEAD